MGFPPTHPLLRTEPRPDEIPLQHVFTALHSTSLGLLVSLTTVILVAGLRRHAVLFSLFASIAVNDILNLLLVSQPLYANWGLCLLSQAGTTAGTALATTNVMSMVALTWSMLMERAGKRLLHDRYLHPLLIWLPWVVFLIVFTISIVSTAMKPDDLFVTVFTCYAQNLYTDLLHVVAILAVLAALVFDIWGIVLFIRNYNERRSFAPDVDSTVGQIVTRPPLNLSFTARVLVFGLAVVAALGAAIVIIAEPSSHVPALFQASIGIICFALFGTQADVWHALHLPTLLSRNGTVRLALHKLSWCSSSSEQSSYFDSQDDGPRTPQTASQTPNQTLQLGGNHQGTIGSTPNPNRRSRRNSFLNETTFDPRRQDMSFGAMFRDDVEVARPKVGGRKPSEIKEKGEKSEGFEMEEAEGEGVCVPVLLGDGRPGAERNGSSSSESSEASGSLGSVVGGSSGGEGKSS